MQHFEFELETPYGPHLFARGWQPDNEPKGVVCIVHGLGDHSGRYAALVDALERGCFAVLAFDLRGHGRSPGQRGHIPGYGYALEDIGCLLKEANIRYPGHAVFLYGHSFGGNLVLNYALRRGSDLSGVVASAPALRTAFEPPSWKVFLAHALARTWPIASMPSGLERAAISRDADVVKAYSCDQLVHDRISARLAVDLLENGTWAIENAGYLATPVLLMHGDADRLTSMHASREFADRAGDVCDFKVWKGHYHELHNDPEREHVFEYLLDWLKQHTPPETSVNE